MPSPGKKAIPTLTVTERRWWHLFAARKGGLDFVVVLGGSIRPPEEVCVDTVPVPYSDDPDLGWPKVASYITSFDHEPSAAEKEAAWPSQASSDEDRLDEGARSHDENLPGGECSLRPPRFSRAGTSLNG